MFSYQNPNMTRNSNQLQNHPEFIAVHGIWAGGMELFLSIINKLNFYNWLVINAMLEL